MRQHRVISLGLAIMVAVAAGAGCGKPTKFASTGPRVYIIKGTSSEHSDGLYRIADELKRNNIAARVYSPDNWLQVVRDIDHRPSEEAILVGHGHGAFLCTQVVRHYAQKDRTKLIDAVICIDPYNKDWPENWCCCCCMDDDAGCAGKGNDKCCSGGDGKCCSGHDGDNTAHGAVALRDCCAVVKDDKCCGKDDKSCGGDDKCCSTGKDTCCTEGKPRSQPTPIPIGHNAQKVYVWRQAASDCRIHGAELVSTRASNVARQHPFRWYDHFWCDRPIIGQCLATDVTKAGIEHTSIDNDDELVKRILWLCRREALSPYHYTPPEHYADVTPPNPGPEPFGER